MGQDTTLGGAATRFPRTHQSAVRAAASADAAERRAGFDALVRGYWKPVYTYLRLRWRADNEEAKDLTQGFFAAALEKRFFDRYQPEKAAFRTFLRLCLDRYVLKQRAAAGRMKRGGGQVVGGLDFEAAERELAARADPRADGEAVLHRAWLRGVFEAAVEAVRQRCAAAGKDVHFQLFARYDLRADGAAAPTYAQVAREFGLTPTQVTNTLHTVRGWFRAQVLEQVRATTGSAAELRSEVRALLGGSPA